MSREKGADDDFFGIEYISSSQTPSTIDEYPPARRPIEKVPTGRSREDEQQLSGTEYLDEAFFPGIRDRVSKYDDMSESEQSVRVQREDERSYIEQQFFQKANTKQSQLNFEDEQGERRFEGLQRSSRKKRNRQEEERYRARPEIEGAEPPAHSGLSELRAPLLPVWNMNETEMMDLLCERVIHSDGNLIAFDKPYGLPYSGGPDNRLQFDRLLQGIKARVAPKVERLHLVKSLDKHQSGVMMFATNKLLQTELRGMIDEGLVENVHRCLVRGKLSESPVTITIPLVKVVNNRDMRLMPLLTNKVKHPVFYVETECRSINCKEESISHLEVTTRKEIPHQLRCHLGQAGCPLVGDPKYNNHVGRPPRLSNRVLARLDISDNQTRKLPIYSHLKEVHIPPFANSAPLRIHAPMPAHFIWILKRLRLMK